MKKHQFINKFESGQVIPLVVGIIFLIFFMVALLIDGGAILSNRRTAQAAADAGALAGAQLACYGYGETEARTIAITYAEENGATSVAVPVVTDATVTVEATIEIDSFFARIFGIPSLPTTAEATAECFALMGKGAIPVAFHCEKDTIGDGLPNEDMYDCIMLGLDWNTELKPLLSGQSKEINGVTYSIKAGDTQILDSNGIPPINKMYIIMDDDKVCISNGGTIQCDLDGDGKDELKFGGQRGFLYLDNVNSLANFISKGPKTDIVIRSHKWLSGDSGVQTSVYNQMMNNNYVGSIVLLPVFNYLCQGDPRTDSTCMDKAHESPWPKLPSGGDDFSAIRGGKDNYHILDFAPFYISCISTSANRCKGYDYAFKNTTGLKSNANIIEGFFITGYDDVTLDSNSTCEINLGNCVISLSK